MKTSLLSDQDDLRIAHYIDDATLPPFLRDLMPLAHTDSERDMLLLSALTGAGCALPNYYALHGPNGKRYYPNLLLFIEARAAQGKSIASIAKKLLKPLGDRGGLFLSADSTHAAFADHLSRQGGHGFCYESEGSVITDTWRRNCSGYNALLRKAAEHEDYTLSRKTTGDLIIPSPRLSMVITGTFDQYRTLVPSATNGLFSRVIPLVIREQTEFNRNIFLATIDAEQKKHTDEPSPEQPYVAATRLLSLHDHLAELETPIRFTFTPEQATDLGEAFYAQSQPLVQTLGANFHQSVARMAVHTLRIAMILTALRHMDKINSEAINAQSALNAEGFKRENFVWTCSNEDFTIARLIGTKLLLHAADAYSQIGADLIDAIPRSRFSLQQQTLLAQLPQEFASHDYEILAEKVGVTARTVRNWMDTWITNGQLVRIKQGLYRKIA